MKVTQMMSRSALKKRMLWIVAGLALTAAGQNVFQSAPRMTPVPRDPLELVTGQIQVAATPASREAVLQLLARARNSYALRNARQAWDLKVSFTVDSLGETNYDGVWEMEDVFSPGQGLHWQAKTSGYTIKGIFAAKATYAEGTASAIPLRLQEARAMLFNPLPSLAYAGGESIRTSTAHFDGSPVTCVLLARSRKVPNPALVRGWDEAEECIDSQSGLLRMHSEAPGRYAVYDYSNAPQLGSHLLPRVVTVTEAGRVVSKISVESLQGIPVADPGLFVPTDGMKAAGQAIAMTSETKIARVQGQGPFTAAMTFRPVCIFGIVTPAGQLVEAHSLQPSDPNSEAAVRDAKGIDFSPSTRAGAPPQQHFVFVIEKFVSPQ
jgi:hypothetical protein